MAATVEAEPRTDLGIRTLIAGDGVRGVGALFVFATHVCLLADPIANNNLLSYGWAAPILGHIDLALSAFFVLSGYLIARPFTRAYVTGGKRPRIRSYVRNRVLRVVPVFYFFTVLVLLRFGLDGSLESGAAAPDDKSEWWQVVGQFLFIQGQTAGPASIPIGPAWSIGSEVGFYFVIPLAAYGAYFVGKRLRGQYARAGFALAAIGFVFVVSIALRALDKYQFAWLTAPPAIMYGFMPGVALGIVEPLIAAPLRERARLAKQLAWGAFALGLLCAIVYTTSDYDPRQTPIHHALGVRAMLAALCTGLLFFGLIVLQIGTGRAPCAVRQQGPALARRALLLVLPRAHLGAARARPPAGHRREPRHAPGDHGRHRLSAHGAERRADIPLHRAAVPAAQDPHDAARPGGGRAARRARARALTRAGTRGVAVGRSR